MANGYFFFLHGGILWNVFYISQQTSWLSETSYHIRRNFCLKHTLKPQHNKQHTVYSCRTTPAHKTSGTEKATQVYMYTDVQYYNKAIHLYTVHVHTIM